MLTQLKHYGLSAALLVAMGVAAPVAQADEPYLGEVRWFAGNFAPRGWAFCDGQLLPIHQYDALFSLLGTMYGGDGRTTFGLPDMRGRAMLHAGTGPGLTPRRSGEKSGAETATVNLNQMGTHSHTLKGHNSRGDTVLPDDRVAADTGRTRVYADAADVNMGASSITSTGGGQPHANVQPFVTLNCIIALQGIFPSRS